MVFDVDRLLVHCESEIARFARDHGHEGFYAFAIDASMLCFNSIEQFAETLQHYQEQWDRQTRRINAISDMTAEDVRDEKHVLDLEEKYCGLDRSDEQACLKAINISRDRRRSEGCEYRTEAGIRSLRENTGDWAYQGFADLDDEHGFDSELYAEHYDQAMESDDGHAPTTQYAVAMTGLVARLRQSDVFRKLRLTDDFAVTWVDHDY